MKIFGQKVTHIEFEGRSVFCGVFDMDKSTVGKKKIKLDDTLSLKGIGGLTKKNAEVLLDILNSVRAREELFFYGQTSPKGMILHGPPGTGKTVLSKSFARSANIENSVIKLISAPEILSKWTGESEGNIRKIFADARQNPGNFYFVIIDEIDAIA